MQLHAHNQNCKPYNFGLRAANFKAGEIIEWRGYELMWDAKQKAYFVGLANKKFAPIYTHQFNALTCALGYIHENGVVTK